MARAPIDGVPGEGEVIAGKYRVERVLGKGGMGVVVAAQRLALRQRVAVKFLLPEALRPPEATGRFEREARAAAIRCEHVARVIDVGTLETGAPPREAPGAPPPVDRGARGGAGAVRHGRGPCARGSHPPVPGPGPRVGAAVRSAGLGAADVAPAP